MPRRIHIVGLGRSGTAAALLAHSNGWEVIASDSGDDSELQKSGEKLREKGIEVFLGGHERALDIDVDLVVISPGIPPQSPVRRSLEKSGVEVISELEFGWQNSKGFMVAITATNGKSTTTALVGHIFKLSPRKAFTCGNIGLPICAVANDTDEMTLLAVEVSSYQLVTIRDFKPEVSMILGISPDHTEYHGGFENYKKAKANIWRNQITDDWVVYNADCPVTVSMVREASAGKFPFSLRNQYETGASVAEGKLTVNIYNNRYAGVDLDDFQLAGDHNRMNALAAMSGAVLAGVNPQVIEKGVKTFSGLPHRIEFIRELHGIRYTNDSKGTNIESGCWALKAMSRPVVLIAGGKSKGGGFNDIARLVKEKVKHLVVMGECRDELLRDLGSVVPNSTAGTLEEALSIARKKASAGDEVLFSPMAASFDMFRNFEDRGDRFRKLVLELSE